MCAAHPDCYGRRLRLCHRLFTGSPNWYSYENNNCTRSIQLNLSLPLSPSPPPGLDWPSGIPGNARGADAHFWADANFWAGRNSLFTAEFGSQSSPVPLSLPPPEGYNQPGLT